MPFSLFLYLSPSIPSLPLSSHCYTHTMSDYLITASTSQECIPMKKSMVCRTHSPPSILSNHYLTPTLSLTVPNHNLYPHMSPVYAILSLSLSLPKFFLSQKRINCDPL